MAESGVDLNPYEPSTRNDGQRGAGDDDARVGCLSNLVFQTVAVGLHLFGFVIAGGIYYFAGGTGLAIVFIGIPIALTFTVYVLLFSPWAKRWEKRWTQQRHRYLREKRRKKREKKSCEET